MGHVAWAAVATTAAFLLSLGCSPDLARMEGRLRIDVDNVPAGADTLRIEVQQTSFSREFVIPTNNESGSLLIQTILAGEVQLQVIALSADVEVARRAVTAVVVAGVESRLQISFFVDRDASVADVMGLDSGLDAGPLDTGVVDSYQAVVTWRVGVTDGDVGGGNDRLTADFPPQSPAFAIYLTNARTELQREPTSFEVVAAEVAAPVLSGLTDFSELFVNITGSFESAGGATSVVFGTATPTASGATMLVNATHVGGLGGLHSDLLNNLFSLRLRGDFPAQPVPTFSADITLTLTIVAR